MWDKEGLKAANRRVGEQPEDAWQRGDSMSAGRAETGLGGLPLPQGQK